MTRTRAYYAETLPNPKLAVFPIAEVAAIGREFGVPLIVDNTAAPILSPAARPWRGHRRLFDHQIHRRPRHVDRRRHHRRRQFRLGKISRTPAGAEHARSQLSWRRLDAGGQADRSGRLYHQGAHHAAARSRRRAVALQRLPHPAGPRDAAAAHGAPLRRTPTPSPPGWRSGRKSTKVIHPSLQTGEARRRADKYLKGGYGALVGFELAGGAEAGRTFIDALQLFYHVANIGDARSLAIHPASTTHSQLAEEAQIATGVSPGYVRLSIGMEHIDDILADLDQALGKLKEPPPPNKVSAKK